MSKETEEPIERPVGSAAKVVGPEREHERQILVDVLARVDLDALADRMLAAYRNEIPAYRRLPSSIMDGRKREITLSDLHLFVRWVSENRPLHDGDLEDVRRSARNDAEDGIPHEDVLQAYRIGGLIAWQTVKDAATPEELQAQMLGTELFMHYAERITTTLSRAYLERSEELRSREDNRYRALFIALTAAPPAPRPKLIELAAQVGAEIQERYRPFAASFGGAGPALSKLASELRSENLISVTEGNAVTGLAPVDFDRAKLKRADLAFAIGEPIEHAQLAQALEDLRLVVELALAAGMSGEADPGQFFLERLLNGSPQLASMLHERVVKPLEGSESRRASELLKTLATFISNDLERKKTAQALHVHPNTLDYRLRQIRETTGLNPGKAEDLALVTLALRHHDVTNAREG